MDLIKYDFDKPSMCVNTDNKLLIEAKDRGFDRGRTPYNNLFNTLFFSGGKLDFKDNLDESFSEKAIPYLRALMGSFSPKHEDKEAVCSMLLSELVNAPKEK